MSDPGPRPPDARDVVARAIADTWRTPPPEPSPGGLYQRAAAAVLRALAQSGHLAPATPGGARPAGMTDAEREACRFAAGALDRRQDRAVLRAVLDELDRQGFR